MGNSISLHGVGLDAIGWHLMVKNWWDKLLAFVVLASFIIGILYLAFVIYQKVRARSRKRKEGVAKVPESVVRYFQGLATGDVQALSPQQASTKKPKTFGVYLGGFANPPTSNQSRLLSQWDLIILDPFQAGVLDALSSQLTPPHIIGRLNIEDLAKSNSIPGKDEVVRALSTVVQTLTTQFKHRAEAGSPFTGVLLANWHIYFPPLVLNELISYLRSINIAVYLEISPPNFMTPEESDRIDMELINGIICRNGTILPNGDRRNYFQMEDVRRAQRALAKHQWAGTSVLMMWETIDDNAELDYSVIKRCFNWCRFNTTPNWIGPKAALTDADVAATRTVPGEPLGAMMWLKSTDVMVIQEVWRKNDKIAKEDAGHQEAYKALEPLFPNLPSRLALYPSSGGNQLQLRGTTAINAEFDWTTQYRDLESNPLSFATDGESHTGMGCFQLGLSCTSVDFDVLVEGQRRLRDLNMLDLLKPEELHKWAEKLKIAYEACRAKPSLVLAARTIKDLLDFIADVKGDNDDRLRVYVGLHSGFHRGTDHQYWGLYDVDGHTGSTQIFISARTTDRLGTFLHTFLSSRQFSRHECFMAEVALAERMGTLSASWDLPQRLVTDIEGLTPSENLLLLQRLKFSTCEEVEHLSSRLQLACEYQLMEVPTLNQLRIQSTSKYLNGEISAEALVEARLDWYREKGCQHPDPAAALSVFEEIDTRLSGALMSGQSQYLDQLEKALQAVLQKGRIDASADIFALSVFCAFRKLAIEEVYLEVLDRNPFPNGAHPDQAACFAEMFALGAQCEAYLDMTSNAVGRILESKYQAYYMKNQIPYRDDKSCELPTSYASMNTDEDSSAGREAVPFYYSVTFLGIFAVPALLDIILLTTIGRGLYLSTFMTQEEKSMATAGLMIALLLVGAIGTWIGHGGSYYLHCMAYPAMNMFVLTRFIAGIALSLTIGFAALIIIGCWKNFYAGFIFFFYFAILSTYLTMLATLAIYQLPGFAYQSGRSKVAMCIPILFISPIICLFVAPHNNIVVYPCVLSGFLVTLTFGARSVLSQWNSWYLDVPIVSDTEVVNWLEKFAEEKGEKVETPEGVNDLAATPLPRKALMVELTKERERRAWTKSTADPFIKKLADGHTSTMFLMDWYCKYSRTKMPYPYSPTWNLQVKAAVDTIKDMQKGLKLHNAFIHWRHGGDEVWCGVLYFIVALMDKWVALFSGGALVGLSDADSGIFRLAVGFGLSYYLLAAVCLDSVASPLWAKANKKTDQPINSLENLKEVNANDAKARRKLYWTNFASFFFMHIWGLCVTSALLWTFEESRDATIMYIAYVGAYTGLLWYQYNRIYTGSLAMVDLIVAAILGLTVGLVLHKHTKFEYSSVVALAITTWTTAALSMRTANVGLPSFFGKDKVKIASDKTPLYHSAGTLGPYPEISQRALSDVFDAAMTLPAEQRYRVDPSTHPGTEVMGILVGQADAPKMGIVESAFPMGDRLIDETVNLWKSGRIVVDLVASRHIFEKDQVMRTVSRDTGDLLHIMVLVANEQTGGDRLADVSKNCKIVAEALMQATTQTKLGLSYDQSILSEMLAVRHLSDRHPAVPEGVKRQLEWSAAERGRVIKNGERETLRYLLLGLDCEMEWDLLPRSIRSFLLSRCCGLPCEIATEESNWIIDNFCAESSLIQQHIARCNLGAVLSSLTTDLARAIQTDFDYRGGPVSDYTDWRRFIGAAEKLYNDTTGAPLREKLLRPIMKAYLGWRFGVKLFVVSLVADPEFQRELDYVIADKNVLIRWPARLFLNGIWNFVKTLQRFIIPFFLFHGRKKVSAIYSEMKGIKTVIHKNNRIVIDTLNGPSTGFLKSQSNGTSEFHLYTGRHAAEPSDTKQLKAISTYSDGLVLQKKEEYSSQTISNVYEYEYSQSEQSGLKIPLTRRCTKGNLDGQHINYDERGYITSGSVIKDGNLMEFKFWYRKNAKYDDELLRAEFALPHIQMKVSWSVSGPKHAEDINYWLPYTKVTEATFKQDSEIYHSKWIYDHRSHPTIETTRNGMPAETPGMIEHDWFGILKKPSDTSFLADNPLFTFKSIDTSFVSRLLGWNIKRYPVSTSLARTHLWKAWKNGKDFDAITTRWLDEESLRSDHILRPYWTCRDMGLLKAAGDYLEEFADAVMARTDIDPDVSSWSTLAYKYGDMMAFGQGGDARINTRSQANQMQDSDDVLHVLAMDTGTWPNDAGGVSACRRDMVNDLSTIRWHVLAENANDFGVPRFQIEKNVQSLSILPLWGLDFLTPTHGIFHDYLDSAVQKRSHNTTEADIKKNFLPILESLVKCARAIKFDRHHVSEASQALLDLNTYFESERHWGEVWMSEVVKQRWREIWLAEDVENARPISEWLDAERPTLLHLDNALDMWHRYLFIFSVPVPEKIPDVFQASHHFTGASYGVLCKLKRNCTLHVWDHCISWREATVFLSSAMSFDSPFVCSSLVHLSRMASVLILHYADVVLPCADFFNPGWEVEHGSQEGILEHRRTFARKIDPVVNGICNMEKFKPIEKIRSTKPTVTMLSHVRFVKDIKNALLAADIIVNEWGFTDYQLDIYGDMEKAPAYSVECKEILASKGLRDNVVLRGLGNPSKVLEEAWIFLNSSISEGLPLAMGEAALFGVPVVCTDVGASFRVVTDPVTWKKFSAVVAPNDALSLARAQIGILALLDEWAAYADDEPGYKPKLSYHPTKEEVKMISDRMYEKAEQRRRLGMMGRANVLSSFSADRYLREHEQLLWIGKEQSPRYLARSRGSDRPMSGGASRPITPVGAMSTRRLKMESPSPFVYAQSRRTTPAASVYSLRLHTPDPEPKSLV